MKTKNIIVLITLIFITFIIFLLPLPRIINVKIPVLNCNNTNIEYTLSLKALKLNYIFKTDKIIPDIKLYSESNLMFDNSANKVKTDIFKLSSQNKEKNIEYISFYFFNTQKNKMDIANLYFDSNKGYFIFEFNNFNYAGPAKNKQDLDNIMNYFEIDNTITAK